MAADQIAESWSQLIELLYADSWFEPLQRFRSPFVFRGSSVVRFDLRSGLLRLARGPVEARQLEPHLLRSFRKYAQTTAIAGESAWKWLALAQHHGLPTRLVDWTWSPLVALHFVTADTNRYEEDGLVLAVDTFKARDFLPPKVKRVISREATGVFSIEMLDQMAGSLAEFDKLDRSAFVAFLDPPALDARLVNQFAAFSVMNDAGAYLENWLARHPALCRRTIIPAALKWEIRDKLDQANVAERMLFPGLDGLCRWLTRYYTPRQLADPGWKGPGRKKIDT
ncbi:MAG: FRG domain-containing protein [Acidobacteria bacterium]|nr:FRG domain-containing protein [Acidobacteriota bacterium]MBV9481808.1 FRG domain-containing protein [Acidobacteriota bacterium]